jgi:hypothetical protein
MRDCGSSTVFGGHHAVGTFGAVELDEWHIVQKKKKKKKKRKKKHKRDTYKWCPAAGKLGWPQQAKAKKKPRPAVHRLVYAFDTPCPECHHSMAMGGAQCTCATEDE